MQVFIIEREIILKRIKMILGAPILDIELTDDMIMQLYYEALEDFDLYSKISKRSTKNLLEIKRHWISKYALVLCKEAIGMIRGKFNGNINIPGGTVVIDYKTLLEEARSEKSFLTNICLYKKI